jgi:acetyl esterase/lipase
MKLKYYVRKEFIMLKPFVMPMNLFALKLLDIGLRMTMFIAPGNRNVKITSETIFTRDQNHIKTMVFTPKKTKGVLPCLLYFPGGGFVNGPGYAHKRNCAKIAAAVGCKIFLFPYRLAPKYAFPTALYDCVDAFKYISDRFYEFHIDPLKIAVGGDSAGGTLAAGCTLILRDEHAKMPCFNMMLYPALDKGTADTPSRKLYTDTPMFNTKRFRFIEKHYYKNGYFGMEKYAFPLINEDYSRLPATYIETAEYDCLHDDGSLANDKLTKAGVAVTLVETKGTFHGYDAVERSPVTKECMKLREAALKQAFGIKIL